MSLEPLQLSSYFIFCHQHYQYDGRANLRVGNVTNANMCRVLKCCLFMEIHFLKV